MQPWHRAQPLHPVCVHLSACFGPRKHGSSLQKRAQALAVAAGDRLKVPVAANPPQQQQDHPRWLRAPMPGPRRRAHTHPQSPAEHNLCTRLPFLPNPSDRSNNNYQKQRHLPPHLPPLPLHGEE